MRLGVAGLKGSGAGIARRLARTGVEVLGFEPGSFVLQEIGQARSLEDLCGRLDRPRQVWLALDSEPMAAAFDRLAGLLDSGDLVVDAGSGRFQDARARAHRLAERGVLCVDAGVFGEAWGLEHGFVLALGGSEEACMQLAPVLERVAGGPGRWVRCGASGAGRFVRQVQELLEQGAARSWAWGLKLIERGPGLPFALADLAATWQEGAALSRTLWEICTAYLAETGEEESPAATLARMIRLAAEGALAYAGQIAAFMGQAGEGGSGKAE